MDGQQSYPTTTALAKHTNRRLTDVVRRLWTDERFLASFRRDPEAALGRYGLTRDEVAAVKSGDEVRLAALGVDVRSLHTSPVSTATLTTLFRVAPRLAALLLAVQLTLAATTSTAARGRGRGRARAARVLRVRYFARAAAGRRTGLVRAVRVQPIGDGQEGGIGLPIDYGTND